MKDYHIREMLPQEFYLLKDFLYEAIFQRDKENLLPKDVINEPELKIYIGDFGRPDDYCLVAEIEGKIIGAVWTRILSDKIKGYGNIDKNTPKFAISIYKEYRNMGIGTNLMKQMLKLLKEKKYKKVSLAVQKDNYALAIYQNVGFEIFKKVEEEYIMIYKIK